MEITDPNYYKLLDLHGSLEKLSDFRELLNRQISIAKTRLKRSKQDLKHRLDNENILCLSLHVFNEGQGILVQERIILELEYILSYLKKEEA
jgi:hypothetical protein